MLPLRRAARPFGLLLVTAAAAACDPCSGIVGCERASIAYQGRIVTSAGLPVPDVEVTFTPDGPGAARPTRSVTDARGTFILRTEPSADGPARGVATVAAPGGVPYHIEGVRLEPVRRGNLVSMDPWLARLVVHDLATFYFRGNGSRLEGGTVTFHRVSGVEIHSGTGTVEVSPYGQAWFEAFPTSAGFVRGRWEVQPRGTDRILVSNDYDYPTEYRVGWYRFPVVPIGPVVAYRGHVVGSSGNPIEGAEVTFVRTSGLEIAGDTLRVRSDAAGAFILHPTLVDPLAYGAVRGRLEIRPPAPLAPRVVPEFALPTHEDDDYRNLDPLTLAPAS